MPKEKYYLTRIVKGQSEYPLFIFYSSHNKRIMENFIQVINKEKKISISTETIPDHLVGRLEIFLDEY